MSRLKKKYSNGQSRGGQPSMRKSGVKNYHAVEIRFHGNESAYSAFVEGGRKGYK